MAAPQPPPAPRNFLVDDSFPDDIARSILGLVPCPEDRASMSLVCKAWRDMIRHLGGQAPPSPPLPWLLLPAANSNSSARVACVLSGCRVHEEHGFPAIIPPGARFVGSHDAAWLLLSLRDPHHHELLNVRTGDALDFPGKMLIPDDPHHRYPVTMVLQAAALSSSPDGATCVAVCIVRAAVSPHYRFIAVWRKGWPCALQIQPPEGIIFAQDVIFHNGAFYLLHADGDQQISIFLAESFQDDDDHVWEHRRFHPGGRLYEDFIRGRYLVSSRGDLLLVVRFAPQPHEPTSDFKLYRATERPHQVPEPDPDFPVADFAWAWTELDSLDGRILFVGLGSSRVYDSDEYPGVMPGVYFFDDEEPDDEAAFFRDHNVSAYACRDNGRYSSGCVHLSFPTTSPSDDSPRPGFSRGEFDVPIR